MNNNILIGFFIGIGYSLFNYDRQLKKQIFQGGTNNLADTPDNLRKEMDELDINYTKQQKTSKKQEEQFPPNPNHLKPEQKKALVRTFKTSDAINIITRRGKKTSYCKDACNRKCNIFCNNENKEKTNNLKYDDQRIPLELVKAVEELKATIAKQQKKQKEQQKKQQQQQQQLNNFVFKRDRVPLLSTQITSGLTTLLQGTQ